MGRFVGVGLLVPVGDGTFFFGARGGSLDGDVEGAGAALGPLVTGVAAALIRVIDLLSVILVDGHRFW